MSLSVEQFTTVTFITCVTSLLPSLLRKSQNGMQVRIKETLAISYLQQIVLNHLTHHRFPMAVPFLLQ